MARLICGGIGVVVLFVTGLLITYARLYRKPTANEAYVRTGGGGGALVILDKGALVIPIIHQIVPVSLETMKLDIERSGHDALITKDNLRVDVRGEFYIRVQPDRDAILQAARSMGGKSVQRDAVGQLVYEKLVSALRSVAATMDLVEIHTNRQAFASAVNEMVRGDLEDHNGITLEAVTISRLDQTDAKLLSDDNIFDSQGKRKITEITAAQKVRTNELEKEAERQIVERNVLTRQMILEQEKAQAEAEATQARDVANIRAERKRQQQEFEIQQAQAVQQAEIAKEQAVQQASLQRDMAIIRQEQEKQQTDIDRKRAVQEAEIAQEQAVQLAKLARDMAIILKEQEMQQTDIQRDQAIQSAELEKQRVLILKEQEKQQADIGRQQAIEVAERQREVAIAEQEAKRAAAQAAALQAEAEREAANQRVLTVEAEAKAEREANVKLIAAKQVIEQDKIKSQTEADVQAYTRIKQAEAEQEAAERQAQARLRLAQAEADSRKLQAEGEMALKMVDVEVERERVKVQQARVEVERQELENKQTFDRAAIEFETMKLQIEANKEVQVAMAQAIGEFMSRGEYRVYGDPTTMSQMMSQMTRGLGVGSLAEGLLGGLPEGITNLVRQAAENLGQAAPKGAPRPGEAMGVSAAADEASVAEAAAE